uniref:Uncharacterized protein n=1 Tax=Mus musculus TaxID=10090 RepID=Q923B5_MOUSE|nr:Hypothetical protein LOC620031 [Mus musculus]
MPLLLAHLSLELTQMFSALSPPAVCTLYIDNPMKAVFTEKLKQQQQFDPGFLCSYESKVRQ